MNMACYRHAVKAKALWNARPSASPNNPVERTAHSAGFFPVRTAVPCGPPLTGGVMLQMKVPAKMRRKEREGFGDELPGQNGYRTWQARWQALHPWHAHHGLRCAGISGLWHVTLSQTV